MTTQNKAATCLLLALLCGGWPWCQPPAAAADSSNALASNRRGAFTFGQVNGVFTVADFASVNGLSQAAGWLTADVTDSTGVSQLGTFTNFPIRVPVSGVLAGDPIPADIIDTPVILPQLSTNTCALLGVVVGDIDLTVPGLGLDVHVNEISLLVRSDRQTTIGDLLCTILGGDLLGAPAVSSGSSPVPASVSQVDPVKSVLTADQLQGLTDIVFSPGLPAVSRAAVTNAPTRQNTSGKERADLELMKNLVQRTVRTMQPGIPQNGQK
jgi:hypothetical protein